MDLNTLLQTFNGEATAVQTATDAVSADKAKLAADTADLAGKSTALDNTASELTDAIEAAVEAAKKGTPPTTQPPSP